MSKRSLGFETETTKASEDATSRVSAEAPSLRIIKSKSNERVTAARDEDSRKL